MWVSSFTSYQWNDQCIVDLTFITYSPIWYSQSHSRNKLNNPEFRNGNNEPSIMRDLLDWKLTFFLLFSHFLVIDPYHSKYTPSSTPRGTGSHGKPVIQQPLGIST